MPGPGVEPAPVTIAVLPSTRPFRSIADPFSCSPSRPVATDPLLPARQQRATAVDATRRRHHGHLGVLDDEAFDSGRSSAQAVAVLEAQHGVPLLGRSQAGQGKKCKDGRNEDKLSQEEPPMIYR